MSEKSRDFDGILAIKPAQDEVASRRRSGRPEAPRQSNFNGILVFVIVLMAIMMAIGGFALWQVQQKLDQANKLLDKGQHDLRDLEDRLSQTGDTASKKFKQMDAQIKTNVSQIDKLWASAWRRNRADIDDNKQAIDGVRKSGDRLQQQYSQLNHSVSSLNSDLNKLTSATNKLKQDWQNQMDDVSTQVSLVRGHMQDQSVTVQGNKREVAALGKQVKSLQDAIKVIDRYRQQVNQQLLNLESRVQAVTPAPASKSSTTAN